MRGIVSAGEAVALDLLGWKNLFDVVYGSSAGAFNGAFFLSDQALKGAQIYLNHVNNRKFINVARPLVGKKILDLEFLLDDVLTHRHPLDWEKVVNSDIDFRVIATDAIRAKPTTVPIGDSQTSLFAALRASAHIPGAHGTKPYHLGGKLLWDAAILDPFGLDTALAEGCTHVMVLLSLPFERERQASVVDKYFIAPHLERINPKLAQAYLEKYGEDIDILERLMLLDDDPRILTVAPPLSGRLPGPLTKNRRLLGEGALAGANSLFDKLDIKQELRHEILNHMKTSLKI